jgi:hypothetical protein
VTKIGCSNTNSGNVTVSVSGSTGFQMPLSWTNHAFEFLSLLHLQWKIVLQVTTMPITVVLSEDVEGRGEVGQD